MIPILAPHAPLPDLYRAFLAQLSSQGFSGEISTDYATRLVTATDNSVYQLLPVAVLFPRHGFKLFLCETLFLRAILPYHRAFGDKAFGEQPHALNRTRAHFYVGMQHNDHPLTITVLHSAGSLDLKIEEEG